MSNPDKPAPKEQVISLYQGSKRIHPKLAKGRFANWRIIAIIATQVVFYLTPWLNWGERQAVWFDIPSRQFHIFAWTLVPGDLIYLTFILLLSAFGLFWWTTIAGRLWCGYACPQTVYTEIMLWIDHLVEGDRNKRLKLDKEPWNARKIRIKAIKYLLIFIVAAWTGISFAGWFVPIRDFAPQVLSLNWAAASNAALIAAAFYGFVTWLFGHIMREQVCLHMCPYARFQSSMFDKDTLIISYDTARGEPRGARKKNATKEESNLGDCINCTMCVQVCPVGIDIRDGLQYQCIGCAACIDACDEIMDKMQYPRGLIRYTTESALAKEYPESKIPSRMLRPRVLGYGIVLAAVAIALAVSLMTRHTVRIDIVKDRGVMVRQNKEGWLENAYNLRFINASQDEKIIHAEVSGLTNIKITGLPEGGVRLNAGEILTVPVQVAVIPEYAERGSNPIEFTFHYADIEQPDVRKTITEEGIFIGE